MRTPIIVLALVILVLSYFLPATGMAIMLVGLLSALADMAMNPRCADWAPFGFGMAFLAYVGILFS